MWNLASLRHGLAKAQEHKSLQSEQMEQPFSEMQASLDGLANSGLEIYGLGLRFEVRVSGLVASHEGFRVWDFGFKVRDGSGVRAGVYGFGGGLRSMVLKGFGCRPFMRLS